MKPIKNVFPACECGKKGYSVNRSESTLVLVRRKRDEDKTPDFQDFRFTFTYIHTPVMSAILNRFDFVPKTHCSSGDCSAS